MPDAPGDDLTLGKEELAVLHAAFIAAFPDPAALARMIRFGLGHNLAALTPNARLETVVHELLQWAQAHGQLRPLVQAAVNANPANPLLRACATRHGIFPAATENTQHATRNTYLADPPDPFVGRAAERAALAARLRDQQQAGRAGSALIHALGGTGKTALGLAVAADLRAAFPRQVQVDLAGAGPTPLSAASALEAACRALGYSDRMPDAPTAARQLYHSLLAAGPPTLLLADDAGDEDQICALAPTAGHAWVITTRQRLTLDGTYGAGECDLAALSEADAATLLIAICPRIGADAAELARLCAYLPLALRLAAGYLHAAPRLVAGYLTALCDDRTRIGTLDEGRRINRSIEAAFALSYAALDPAAQTALLALSIFPAPFARAAALAVPDPPPAEAILDDLYRRHLLEWDAAADRFWLHDLVRDFAHARLSVETAAALALRHAQYYAEVMETANRLYLTKDRLLDALALFDRERAHLDAGWGWARSHAGTPAADALLLAYADAAAGIADIRYYARAERIPQLEFQRDAARRLGDKGAEGAALGNLGNAYAALGETQRAVEYHEQDLAISRAIGNRQGEGHALGNLGIAHKNLGELAKAIDYQEQHLALAREIGDRRGEGHALGNLGNAYQILGELTKAIGYYEQHLALAREIGDRRGEIPTLGNLGTAYENLGELAKAIGYYEQHLALAREIGDQRNEGNALGNLGNAYYSLGEGRRAIDYQEQHLALAREIGDRRGEGHALNNLGNTYVLLGDPARAVGYYEQYLTIAREIEDQQGEAISSWNLGLLLVIQGERERGAALMQVQVDYLRTLGHANAEAAAVYLSQVRAGAG